MTRERLNDESRVETLLRRSKVTLLRGRRLASWALERRRWQRPSLASAEEFEHLHRQLIVPIERDDAGADPRFEAGKRQNIALAAPSFNGLVVAPQVPLSFWRALGRPTAQRGYVYGMELRGGCLVPSLGGGLCLISNSLFRLGAELGWSILERHGHTLDAGFPTDGQWGMDATVFWPYVDLRMAPRQGERWLGMTVRDGALHIEVRGREPLELATRIYEVASDREGDHRTNSIAREVLSLRGEVVEIGTIAENAKHVLPVVEQRRNCLTCNEQCDARPAMAGLGVERDA